MSELPHMGFEPEPRYEDEPERPNWLLIVAILGASAVIVYGMLQLFERV